MPFSQFALPWRPAFDSMARVLPGAKLWFTLTGTNTPSAPYQDTGGTTPHANPVIANAVGRFPPVYLDDAVTYRARLYESDQTPGVDTPLEDIDPYSGFGVGDLSLRGDLAHSAGSGSLLIKHKSSKANTFARSLAQQAKFGAIDDDTNAIHYIDDDLDEDLLDGSNTTDLRTYLQNGLDTGQSRLALPPIKYRFNSSLEIDHGQALTGLHRLPGNWNTTDPAHQDARAAVLEFRPGAADTAIIVKPSGISANGFYGENATVEDIVLDLNRVDVVGIAFMQSYANRIERVAMRGTCQWAVVMNDNYVSDIIRLNTQNLSMRRGAVLLGENTNHIDVDRLHTGGAFPNDAATPSVGVAIKGGFGHSVRRSLFQGLTIGQDVYGGVGHEFKGNYYENTLCAQRWGINGGTTYPSYCKVSGGVWEPVEASHTQYASRGPVIYLAAGTGLKFENFRFGRGHATDANIWPVVLGGFGATYDADFDNVGVFSSHFLNEVERTAGGHNWSIGYSGLVETTLDHGDRGFLMKASDAYNSEHQIMTVNNAGTLSAAANWTPGSTATISALLATAFSTPTVP
jgi:hypothetical protein